MKRLLCAFALLVFACAPALADPKSDVMAAMGQFAKATSYHVSANERGRTMEADMALPRKMHVTSAAFEMIKIDSATWVKINGAWKKFEIPGMEQMLSGLTGAVATVRNRTDDMVVTDLGMKTPTSGGPPLHAYAVRNKAGKSPSTIYLDAGMLAEVDSGDGTSVKFSKFNAPVDIQPPAAI